MKSYQVDDATLRAAIRDHLHIVDEATWFHEGRMQLFQSLVSNEIVGVNEWHSFKRFLDLVLQERNLAEEE